MSLGNLEKLREGFLLYSPILFANTEFAKDESPTSNPSFQGTKTVLKKYSLGLSQTTPFGLAGTFGFEFSDYRLSGTNPSTVPLPDYYNGKPYIELNQSIWRNGFGRETRALKELTEASAKATSFTEQYQTKLILASAETAYWNLVGARKIVLVEQQSLERAKQFREWNAERVRLNLADKSDLLQADAAFKVRELQLQYAVDSLRNLSLNFNIYRGLSKVEVPEELQSFNLEDILKVSLPEKTGLRDDVMAANEWRRVARSTATIGREKNSPTFDMYGSLALNSRDASFSGAFSDAFSTDNPTMAIGLRFMTPLMFWDQKDVRAGYEREIRAAEFKFRRSLQEEQKDWQDIILQYGEAKKRLELLQKIEVIQQQKLDHERQRHRQGRSTTYQVLLFEQDYANSRLTLINAVTELLNLLAQMKTFRGSP